MRRRLPFTATLLGLGGLIPFLACGFGAVWLLQPVNAARLLAGLITYGAVILSFLGAVHWGAVLEDEVGLADRPRLVLGVLPALIGWAALLIFLEHQPIAALALLVAGFLAVQAFEGRAARAALIPRGYLVLRWVLTTVVVLVLLAVLVIRAAGLNVHRIGHDINPPDAASRQSQ